MQNLESVHPFIEKQSQTSLNSTICYIRTEDRISVSGGGSWIFSSCTPLTICIAHSNSIILCHFTTSSAYQVEGFIFLDVPMGYMCKGSRS